MLKVNQDQIFVHNFTFEALAIAGIWKGRCLMRAFFNCGENSVHHWSLCNVYPRFVKISQLLFEAIWRAWKPGSWKDPFPRSEGPGCNFWAGLTAELHAHAFGRVRVLPWVTLHGWSFTNWLILVFDTHIIKPTKFHEKRQRFIASTIPIDNCSCEFLYIMLIWLESDFNGC